MNMKEMIRSLKEGDDVFVKESSCLNSRVPDVFTNMKVVKIGRKFIELKTNEGNIVKCELTIGSQFYFASGDFGIYQMRHIYFSRQDLENEKNWKEMTSIDNLRELSVEKKQEILNIILKK